MGLFLSCGGKLSVFLEWRRVCRGDGYVGELLELPKGCQVPLRGSGGEVGYLSKRCSGKGPHPVLRGESPGLSPVRLGNLGFLSSCDGDFRDPLVLPQKIQVSFRVARGRLGFLSSWCRGLEPHLELRRETQGSSPALTEISGFHWTFHWGARRRLMLGHGTPLPSRCGKGMSRLLSS